MKSQPSDRVFGVFASGVSAGVGTYLWLAHPGIVGRWILLGASALLLALTLAAPKMLRPLKRAWFMLGELLGRIVSPLVLMAIFFVLLTPIALVARWFGRDELRLRKQSAQSYWIARAQQDVSADSFHNQF